MVLELGKFIAGGPLLFYRVYIKIGVYKGILFLIFCSKTYIVGTR